MADTVRTLSALQTLLADNTAGDIGAQDIRDFLVSVYPYGRPATAGEYDDEFLRIESGTPTGWTLFTTSGSQTITTNGRCSVTYSGQTANDLNGIGKAMSLGTGDYVRAGYSKLYADNAADNFDMVGVFMSDGLGTTANCIAVLTYTASTRLTIMEGTITNLTEVVSSTYTNNMPYGELHVELEYGGTNSFDMRISSDGISWLDHTLANAFTLTPTHAGLCWTTWGGANTKMVSFDYFRSNATS